MKQQTKAYIKKAELDGKKISLPGEVTVSLELSAIDTGGGFHDPIVDFAFTLQGSFGDLQTDKKCTINLLIGNPGNTDDTIDFSYEGKLKSTNGQQVELMGRLQDEQVDREMVRFIMRCVR